MNAVRAPAQDPNPVLLVTKFHPPAARGHTVHRERLIGRLRAQPGCKLTLVAAPAGSGKTTLLASWREIEAAENAYAWVSIDEDDNDVVGLWAHIVEALCRVAPALEDSASPGLIADASDLPVVLRRLMNALADQGEIVLILDDFHRLSSGPARDSIRWLVDHAPAAFRLVISTRSEPALPLAALRARGELLEVRYSDLRFTPEETDALVNGRLGLDLTRKDVGLLADRTEGWAAGLYLAALSLAAVDDRHAHIGTLSATHRYIADFLTEEVLDASDPATRELMLRCSVLERLCGSLCDSVLESEGAAELLSALSRTNLFLVSVDDDGEWFRFHSLFGEMLRMELERREPGSSAALHRRAYEWHRREGRVADAIDHALSAGAFAEAVELVEAAWNRYATAGRYATVLGWLLRFPDEVVRDNNRLLLVQSWVLGMSGRAVEAVDNVSAIEQMGGFQEGPLADGCSSVEASLSLLRAVFPGGDVGAQLVNARRAEELEPPGTPWRCVALWAVGWGLYFSGQSEQARPWFEESSELAPGSEQWMVAGSSRAFLSFIAGERGDLEQQREFAEEAVALAREHGNYEHACEVPLSYATSSACSTLEESLPYVEHGLAGLRAWRQPIDTAHGLIIKAAMLQRFNDRQGAASAIAEAESLLELCPDPGVLPMRLGLLKRQQQSPTSEQRGAALTERELTVLRLLGGTLSERDIGRELYVSHNTVHGHVRSIYRKLDVSSRKVALERARELQYL